MIPQEVMEVFTAEAPVVS